MGEERVATAAKSLTGMQFVMQDMIFLEGLLSSFTLGFTPALRQLGYFLVRQLPLSNKTLRRYARRPFYLTPKIFGVSYTNSILETNRTLTILEEN